jgi:hypothetical protein
VVDAIVDGKKKKSVEEAKKKQMKREGSNPCYTLRQRRSWNSARPTYTKSDSSQGARASEE